MGAVRGLKAIGWNPELAGGSVSVPLAGLNASDACTYLHLGHQRRPPPLQGWGSTGLVDVLQVQLTKSVASVGELGDVPGSDLVLGNIRQQAIGVFDSTLEHVG